MTPAGPESASGQELAQSRDARVRLDLEIGPPLDDAAGGIHEEQGHVVGQTALARRPIPSAPVRRRTSSGPPVRKCHVARSTP
jgi:hypothetical protein